MCLRFCIIQKDVYEACLAGRVEELLRLVGTDANMIVKVSESSDGTTQHKINNA